MNVCLIHFNVHDLEKKMFSKRLHHHYYFGVAVQKNQETVAIF